MIVSAGVSTAMARIDSSKRLENVIHRSFLENAARPCKRKELPM